MVLMKHQENEQAKACLRPNLTGIPAQLKLELEERSGMSFDDVRVHYSSDRPARLNALAYTQGNQVYVGPGQEKHLRHELGHVVQQKLGQVPVTRKVNGMPVNDNPQLEAQADHFLSQGIRLPVHEERRHRSVIQRCSGKDEFVDQYLGNLQKLLNGDRGWWDISEDQCRRLLGQLYDGKTPQIPNHYARLTMRGTRLYIQKVFPSGDGGHMRTSSTGVRYGIIEDDWYGPPQIADDSVYRQLDRTNLRRHKRELANKVMGRSASDAAGQTGVEYLHRIAHQLGGAESPDNLFIGTHALNTAMMPVEKAVHDLVAAGNELGYKVEEVNHMKRSLNPVSAVKITVSARNSERKQYCHSFTFYARRDVGAPNNDTYMLNEDDYCTIQEKVNEWVENLENFTKGAKYSKRR